MQLSFAFEQHVAQPAEMVEAEVVVAAYRRRQADRVGGVLEHLHRRVADADQARVGFLMHRLRDDADGIGEVDHPRPRREARDHAAVLDHRRDRAHRHGEAGRADCLLADDVVRDARSASSLARCAAPPTRMLVTTKSAPSMAGFRCGGGRDLDAVRHLRREAGDDAQAILIDVVERDLRRCADPSATSRPRATERGRPRLR